jgi:DNA-binding NtrC family response regulator
MSVFKIFIVEDDPWYAQILKHQISMNPDFEVSIFSNGKSCLEQLYQKPNAITIDFHLPDMKGEQLIDSIKATNNEIPLIVISGQEEISVAVDLLKKGISDYIIKNDNTKTFIWNALLKIFENQKLKDELETLHDKLETRYDFENTILGKSKAINSIYSLIEKATKSNISISVTGETGTGKEIVAKAIHYNSERKRKPFIALNMGAIPSELIESELFGHEKGAFTGANSRKIGKFEEANGGTIFLDEIAELDLNVQSKLLRVLQEREIVRLGSNTPIKFDARLITATHKNLTDEVNKGHFRKDLFYRILGLPIELPPLRDREKDILILAKSFSNSFAKENKLNSITISREAQEKLLKYNFPGNVRELKSVIELACIMCNNSIIEPQHINFNSLKLDEIHLIQEKSLKEYNIDIISFFLKRYNSNVVQVANKLNIGKSTIYNMIKAGEINMDNL